MKKLLVVLMALAMVVSMLAVFPLAVSADGEEAEASVWSGKANIKWYVDTLAEDPEAKEFHLNSAEDLAGLAYLVNAYFDSTRQKTCYNGVWYDTASGDVLGFSLSGYEGAYAYNYTELGFYIPAPAEKFNATTGKYLPEYDAGYEHIVDGSALIEGDSFVYKTVILETDVILNTGSAADWKETAPANVWMPIGGGRHIDATSVSFNGTFLGNGHTVSGVYFSSDDGDLFACGLFGYLAKGYTVTVQDLVIDNSYIRGGTNIGGLVGRTNNMVIVTNCHVKNSFISANSHYAGSFVGHVQGGTFSMEQCSAFDMSIEAPMAVGVFAGGVSWQSAYYVDCIGTGTVRGYTTPVVDEEGNETGTKGGWDVGGLEGRVAQGGLTASNVILDVTLIQEAADFDNENSSYTAAAGIIYGAAGKTDGTPESRISGPSPLSIENVYYVDGKIQANGHVYEYPMALAVNESQLLGNAPRVNLPIGEDGFDFTNVWAYGSTNEADSISARLPQLRNAGKSTTETEEPEEPENPEDQHVFGTLIKGTKATCEEPGEKAHYHCTHCEKDFDEDYIEITDGLTIPAKGHKYGNLVPEKAATADEDGMKAHYKCSSCGKYFDENKAEVTAASLVIPKTGNGEAEKKGCFGVVAGVPFVAVVVFGAAMLVRKKENEGK